MNEFPYLTYRKRKLNYAHRLVPTGRFCTMPLKVPYTNTTVLAHRIDTFADWCPYNFDMNNKAQYYHEFDIPKRNGGVRHIKEPLGDMKRAQRSICNKLKYQLQVLPHDCAHGFVKKRSCKTAMIRHQEAQSRWFVKFDLHNFFPSCSKEMVVEAFKNIAQLRYIMSEELMNQVADVLTDETGHLTQGCVSSPYIANLILLDFDVKLNEYCEHNHLTYTRYADDLCISGQYQFDWKAISRKIQEWLPEGIYMNFEKTKYTSYNQENIFLGIHYNQEMNLTVGYKTKRLMKVIAHKARLGQIPEEQLPTWKGRLAYYKAIEPEYFNSEIFNMESD